MYQTVYLIVPAEGGDYYDEEQTINYAKDVFHRDVCSNTGFDSAKAYGEDPSPIDSPNGEEYIENALTHTQNTIENAIETIHDAFNEADNGETPDWEMFINEREVNYAAFEIGQGRGLATYLFDHHGHGIRTHEELDEYLNFTARNGIETSPTSNNEFLAVVPLKAHS